MAYTRIRLYPCIRISDATKNHISYACGIKVLPNTAVDVCSLHVWRGSVFCLPHTNKLGDHLYPSILYFVCAQHWRCWRHLSCVFAQATKYGRARLVGWPQMCAPPIPPGRVVKCVLRSVIIAKVTEMRISSNDWAMNHRHRVTFEPFSPAPIRSRTPSRHSTGAPTDLCSISLGSSIIELGPNFVIVHLISAYIPWATYPLCRWQAIKASSKTVARES